MLSLLLALTVAASASVPFKAPAKVAPVALPRCAAGSVATSGDGKAWTCASLVTSATSAASARDLLCENSCVSDPEIASVGLSKVSGWPVCPPGQVLTVPDAGAPVCVAVTAAAPTYPNCPSGQFLTADGGLLCSPLPAAAGVVRTTSNIALPPSTQATPIDLTGLAWPVAGGAQSSFECFLPVTVTGATNGPRFTLTLASATDVRIQAVEFKTTAIAAVYEVITATGTFTAAVTSGATANANSVWQLRGTLTGPAGASTAQIRGMASNGADAGVGNGLTVRKGAWCWFY